MARQEGECSTGGARAGTDADLLELGRRRKITARKGTFSRKATESNCWLI